MDQAPVWAGLALALGALMAVSASAQTETLTITPPADKTIEARLAETPLTSSHYGRATAVTTTDEKIKIKNDAPKKFPVGKTTITWTATTATAEVTATQTVTLQDTTGPRITPPPCLTFEATGALTKLTPDDYGSATATDAPSGVRSITNNAPTAGFPIGLTFIKYTATDNRNNESSKNGCVYVVDTTPPKITIPAPYIIEATAEQTPTNSANYGTATATDTVTPTPKLKITSNATAKFPVGTTPIKWTATDDSENSSSGIQMITVVDTTPPTLTVPPVVVIEATAPKSRISDDDLGTVTATDLADPELAPKNDLREAGLETGVHRVMWNATDSSDNTRWATQVVAVVDTTPPKVTPPSDVIIDSSSPVSASLVNIGTARAMDLVDLLRPTTSDAPDTFPVGSTTVTWTATDTSKISGTATQKVTVAPNQILRTVTPPNALTPKSNGFGNALAHSGDLLFVGNPLHSTPTHKKVGAVHVYGISDGALDRTLFYNADTQHQHRHFGGSISVVEKAGGGSAIAVGARGNNADGKFVGSVQIFDPETGAHLRTINNPAASAGGGAGVGDAFGAFTATLGDKIVIAAHKYDDNATNDDASDDVSDAGRVYVYDATNGALLHTIQNPDAQANDMFGMGLAAFEDDTGEYVYVGSRKHETKNGAAYAFKLGTADRLWVTAAAPGTTDTRYASEAIVPDGMGGLFVGEPHKQASTTRASKVHHYGPDASPSTIEAHSCCARDFGSSLAVSNGLLYVGDRHAKNNIGKITAYNATSKEYKGAFTNPGTSKHFGFALEPLGGTLLAASEYSGTTKTSSVHILDLPSIAGIRPLSATAASGAAGEGTAPTLDPPTLLSTSYGSGSIVLTYNVDIDPFEADLDDYDLGTSHTAVSVAASGKTITLSYLADVGGAPNPTVNMVGDLGLYVIPGGAQ